MFIIWAGSHLGHYDERLVRVGAAPRHGQQLRVASASDGVERVAHLASAQSRARGVAALAAQRSQSDSEETVVPPDGRHVRAAQPWRRRLEARGEVSDELFRRGETHLSGAGHGPRLRLHLVWMASGVCGARTSQREV